MSSEVTRQSASWRRVFEEPPRRLVSLDVYRGAVMLLLISGGLGIVQMARQEGMQDHLPLQWIARQLQHVPWEGCVLWDMIQPCFMFISGVSLAYSLENRSQSQSTIGIVFHTLWRSLLLVALGVFIRSQNVPQTNFRFDDVLAQIGLGYFFVFLLWRQPRAAQLVIAICVLITYWCFFQFYPAAADFPYAAAKAPDDYLILEGTRSHWNIHNNPAAAFDVWFMNLFPRLAPFVNHPGGYTTLNFIPSAVTMLFGLMAGEWLRDDRSSERRVGVLLLAGAAGIGIGYVLHVTGVCPVVKRIWTPAWTLYSTGWASVALGVCYFMFDMNNLRPLAGPVTAIGRNSILIYMLYYLLRPWLIASAKIHGGRPLFVWLAEHGWLPAQVRETWKTAPPEHIFALFGQYEPVAENVFVLAVLWLIALWLHERKAYVKI